MPTRSLDMSECDVCLKEPNNPRLLPCCHVFCLECLLKEHQSGVQQELYTSKQVCCPYCNKLSEVPTGGLKAFAKDRMSLEVGQLLKDRKRDMKSLRKGITSDNELHSLIKDDPHNAKVLLEKLSKFDRHQAVYDLVDGHSALDVAISEDAVELMSYLIEKCQADVEQATEATLTLSGETHTTTFTPLLYAAYYDNVAAATVLTKHGADVNAANDEGITPLYIASEQNSTDMLNFLIESGADVDAQDDLEVTSLMNARKNPEVRSFLLSKGADVNKSNIDGFTGLHYAAAEGCIESVKVFLQYHADLSKQNRFGNTPLHDGVYKGHMEVARLLLSHGADPNVKNEFGNTVLHFAVYKGKIAIVQLLLNQGADPYIRNNNQEDCFLKAVLECQTEVLGLLTNKHVQAFYK